MAGFIRTNYKTIVMDGSDKHKVDDIKSILQCVSYPREYNIDCRPMDNEHPTMLVITSKNNVKTYNNAKEIIESKYPGLCTFEAVM